MGMHLPDPAAATPQPFLCTVFDSPAGHLHGVNALTLFREELWVGTNAGVLTFDGGEFHPAPFGDLAATPVSVSCFLNERDTVLWAGTERHGLFMLSEGQWERFDADSMVTALVRDSRGRLVVGTRRGAYVFEDGMRFVPPDLAGFDGLDITSMALAPDGCLWVVCGGGLHAVHPDGAAMAVAADPPLWRVYADRAGGVWVSTADARVLRLVDGQLAPFGDPWPAAPYEIDGMFEDANHQMWFATRGAGVVRWDGTTLTTFNSEDGLADDKTCCVVEDGNGQIWVGHYLSGISLLDFTTIERLSGSPVTEFLHRDPNGRIWFSNGAELHCLAGSATVTMEFPRNVMALTEAAGAVWAATLGDGAYRFDSWDSLFDAACDPDPLKWQASATRFGVDEGLPSDSVACLFRARDGALWAGTRFPGALCRLEDGRFRSWETPGATVFRILEDRYGRVWCGGWNGGGLQCLDNGALRTYTPADGLPDDSVQCLLEDDAGLVVGTQYGGARVEFAGREEIRVRPHGPDDARQFFFQCAATAENGEQWFGTIQGGALRLRDGRFQQTTRRDGLPGNSISGLAPEPDGSMLVGTYRGLVRYRVSATRPPITWIARAFADRTYEKPQAVVVTASGAQALTFEFAATDLASRRVRFAYVLEGYDSGWRETWEPRVRYENVPEGDYVLRVRAIGRDLAASPRDAELPVTVRTAPLEKRLRDYETQLGEMERLLHEERRANRYNRALTDLVTNHLPGLAPLEETLQRICHTAARTLDVELCSVWLIDRERGRIRCAEQFRAANETHQTKELELSRTPYFAEAAKLLEHRRVLSAPDAEAHPASAPFYQKCFVKEDIRACLTAGIRTRGAVTGVLFVGYRGATRPWDADEEQFVASLADIVSLALVAEERRLAEEALRESERTLEQSQRLEAVGRLASGVAHDFNNLLTAMLGCTDLLLCQVQPRDPKHGLLEEIREAGERAGTLTRQLLAFSQKHEVQPRHLILGAIVGDMEKMLRRIIGEDIVLKVERAPGERPLRADPCQLELVVMNLVVNARDAMPRGGTVRVRTGSRFLRRADLPPALAGREDWFSVLEVRDEGEGIPADALPSIFEPFYTTKGSQGTGLGLATVHGVASRYGGCVTVESERGRGSTFRVMFPCVAGVVAPGAATQPEPASEPGLGQPSGETVLVVEDEAMVRHLVSRILESGGYRVVLARSAEEAMALLDDAADAAAGFDLLLTDIVMPGISGIDLTKRVRERLPGVPVLHMSGYSRAAEDAAGADEVCQPDGFLQKPFRRDDLLAAVGRVLELRGARRA